VNPGGQTPPPPRAEVASPTAMPCATPSSHTSPTLVAPGAEPTTSATPHAAPSTPPTPCVALTSTTPVASTAALASQLYLLHYSRHPQATREPPAPPLQQHTPLAKVVPVAPPVNPHLMTMRAKWGFRLPADRLTLLATLAPTLSPVPSSVYTALVDPNWCCAMEEEFAALIANNT
jgi:hypothetical protein